MFAAGGAFVYYILIPNVWRFFASFEEALAWIRQTAETR